MNSIYINNITRVEDKCEKKWGYQERHVEDNQVVEEHDFVDVVELIAVFGQLPLYAWLHVQ